MNGFLETVGVGAIWGVGFGLGMGLVGAAGGGVRSIAKGVIGGGVAVADWVRGATENGRATLQDLYSEAKAERSARE
jgi:hypothetical protein